MSKIPDHDFRGLPQEVIDFKDEVTELLNFGKYQPQVVTSAPTWIGRGGEQVLYVTDTTGRLYVNTADQAVAWSVALEWIL